MSRFFRNALATLALVLPATALAQPVINAVTNNFGGSLPGLPSYGIAPASTFVIYGSGLCASAPLAVQSSSSGTGLPQKLNGMTISVTVNGVTTTPAIYYAIPTQVAAVLPSTTPVGTGTITVAYNGKSGTAPLVVAKSAFGILTANAAGSGLVKAYDLNYKDITPTASAAPGQIIILWGSGLGADTANNDRTYPMKQDDLKDATVYIGGVKADVIFAGRSQYPGEDQIDVYVPELGATPAFRPASLEGYDEPRASSGFQAGCAISLVVVANGNTSNFGTLPVAVGNGVCKDTAYGVTGNGFPQSSLSTVNVGGLGIYQLTQPTSALPAAQTYATAYSVFGDFFSEAGNNFVNGAPSLSPGSCSVSTSSTKPPASTPLPVTKPLNVGTPIMLTGPDALSVSVPEVLTTPVAEYAAAFTTPALTADAQYAFKVPGAGAIPPFTATFTWQDPLEWTNEASTGTITESDGQLITWSGGAPDSWVIISGSSTAPAASLSVAFYCTALASDKQLMLPPYLLETLPAGTGTLFIENEAPPQTFTAKGIDFGYIVSGLISYENVTYQVDASSTPTPPAESPFNGTYTGSFTETYNGQTQSGGVAAVIDNGIFTVTKPGTGSGTVSSTGQITFGVDVTEGVSCNFSGQVVVTGTAATASGAFTCVSPPITGTWSITRQSE